MRPYIIAPPRQQRTKREGKRKESPKIRNLRPYIIGRGWGPHPAAADQTRRKQKGKPQNQKFEALYNREGLGPPPGQQRTKREGKKKKSPKIRNLRPYIIGRGWPPHPAAAESPKEKEREKGKPKNQKFEALYNREGLGPPTRKEKEKPKNQKFEALYNQKFEALYNREGLGPPPGSSGPKEKEREKGKPKNQKFEALYKREALGPPPSSSGKPKREGKRERKAQKSEI